MVDGEQLGLVDLVFGGDEALQLFGPVDDHFQLHRRLLIGLDHQEPLAVGAHVVVRWPKIRALVAPLEEDPGFARGESPSAVISTAIVLSPLR